MRMRFLTLFALAASALFAATAEPFKANDTVTYIGDSITHGGTYHSIVTLYYATRFPGRPIRFYNCGIGGDRASSIMSDEVYRLKIDILSHKPTAATIMLGMNDIGRTDYAEGKSGPEIMEKRKQSVEIYKENMQKLIAALKGAGVKLTLLTPSIYEEAPKLNGARIGALTAGANATLGQCGQLVKGWAKENGAGVADFWTYMNQINAQERKKDPMFTIVGPDRVHPGPVGHFVMGYVLLKAQGVPRDVARVVVDGKKAGQSVNAKVDAVKKSKTGVEFDALENALPFVAPEEAKAALAMVPFDAEMNQEILQVKGLKKGKYALTIDGAAVGEYTSDELKKGVNLAGNEATPQYKQSAEATRINSDRVKAAQKIRGVVAQKYGMSRAKVDVMDGDALLKAATARKSQPVLDDLKAPGKNEREYEELMAALYKATQPKSHHYTLAKK